MAKLHHSTLKAAVTKYAALLPASEAEIKEAISQDEKGFDEDQAHEIYEAILANEKPAGDPAPKEQKPAEKAPGESKQSAPPKKDAPPEKEAHTKTEGGVFVTKAFRDRNDFSKEWKEGDDVSHFDKTRLEHLISIGHASRK